MKNWISFVCLLGFLVFSPLHAERRPILFQEAKELDEPFLSVIVYQYAEGKWVENVYWMGLKEDFSEEFGKLVINLALEGKTYLLQPLLVGPASMQDKVPGLEEEMEEVCSFVSTIIQDSFSPSYNTCHSLLRQPRMAGWGDSEEEEQADEPPASEEARPFFNLPLSAEDKKNIRRLLTVMADKNLVQLFLEQRSVEKIGDKVRHIHPLRFAGFILADPYLRRCLRAIERDSIKWGYFIEGYEEGMRKEHKAGRLSACLPGFAELLGVTRKEVQVFVQKKDYVGLIRNFLSD